VDRGSGTLDHRRFRDLPELLRAGDRLVVNDTRVVPARLLGTREGTAGTVEFLLIRPLGAVSGRPHYEALARPARKCLPGSVFRMGESRLALEVVEVLDAKRRRVAFPEDVDVPGFLEREGHVPLPPYIRRDDAPEDRARYQTVYAARPGAVAAPTAGLHFTPAVLAALEARGIPVTRITLDVGPGTFLPVTEEDPARHVMERERYAVSPDAAAAIAATRGAGGRIVAVGTTVVRTLETTGGDAGLGETALYIHPPFPFEVTGALLTNFHLPRSTLLMLVSAFGGTELIRRAYAEAVAERYRFYSYGDAMLVV
jgi:S-adenosylmethionine:tRNA ribosyltransferase-isomerase